VPFARGARLDSLPPGFSIRLLPRGQGVVLGPCGCPRVTQEPSGISRGIVARYTSRNGMLGYRAPDRAEEAQMSLRVIVFSDYV